MKKHITTTMCILAICSSIFVNGAQKDEEKPNIILICADDLNV